MQSRLPRFYVVRHPRLLRSLHTLSRIAEDAWTLLFPFGNFHDNLGNAITTLLFQDLAKCSDVSSPVHQSLRQLSRDP